MSSAARNLHNVTRENLVPEIEETAPSPVPAKDEATEPLIFSVMSRLAEVLGEETKLIREGNFEAFAELQREKSNLIRQAERLEHARDALGPAGDIDTNMIKLRLDGFNQTVEANMRAIGAVKDAISHVRSQAIRKLEEEKGDGVYARDGGKKSLHHLSLQESKVKL